MMKSLCRQLVVAFVLFFGCASIAFAGNIDPVHPFAWGENIGWLNFGSNEGNVVVTTLGITGAVWGENVGWISLDCGTTGSCGTVSYGIVRTGNVLTGYAWGENLGWVSFNCSNTASCGTVDYGVSVDAQGVFTGYAWAENVGWISFNCSNGGTCGTVDYYLKTTLVTGGVVIVPPPPSGTPTPTPTPTPTGNAAACSNIIAPNSVSTGQSFSATVSMLNTGTTTWTNDATPHRLGSANPQDTLRWSIGRVNLQVATVPPGQTASFIFTANAPGSPGVYAFDWRMVEESIEWFGAVCAKMITVTGGVVLTPTPTPIPTFTPFPTATPFPTGTPFPTSTPIIIGPTSTPGPIEPTALPPTFGPTTPPIDGVSSTSSLADFFDDLANSIFGSAGCSGVVGLAACAVTAPALAVGVLLVMAMLLQQEVLAVAHSGFIFFGLIPKPRVWGTVYDSTTRRPIPYVHVELLDENNRVIESRYADRDGKYGFLTTPQALSLGTLTVYVRASKPAYRFPSAATPTGTDYIVYEHPYAGGPLVLQGDAIVNVNIPMDSVSPDRARWSGVGTSLIGALGDRLLALGFYIGLVLVPLNIWYHPTAATIGLGIVFFAVNAFRIFAVYRPYGIVLDSATGKPLPYALVTLNDTSGKRVAFAVSDQYGRYILQGERGKEYDLSIYTPANVLPMRQERRHIALSGSSWLTQKLTI